MSSSGLSPASSYFVITCLARGKKENQCFFVPRSLIQMECGERAAGIAEDEGMSADTAQGADRA